MVRIINPDEIQGNSVPGHEGIIVKNLAAKSLGSKFLGVGLGEVPPGGYIEPHRHEDCEHCYYIAKGTLTIISDLGRTPLKEGMAFWIGINELHGMANETKENARYLAITAPPPF
jgi:quercetin dioxygenase-like cupin family protein